METYVVLEKALALIEDEKDWCQGNKGMDGGDSHCAEGAVGCALGIKGREYTGIQSTEAYRALREALAGRALTVWMFNDNRTHAEVVALFQEAIREEKRKAGIPIDVPEPQREKASV